jgi:hypothetical protein
MGSVGRGSKRYIAGEKTETRRELNGQGDVEDVLIPQG